MNDYVWLIIKVAVIGGIFIFCWKKGYIQRLGLYWRETMVELNKCAWPTTEELQGSTAVVMVTIVVLGAFIMLVDAAVLWVVTALVSA